MERDRNFIYLFGVNAVMEKLKASPGDVAEVFIVDGSVRPALRKLDEEARRHSLPVKYMSSQLLDRMADGQRHQGVVARVDVGTYFPLEALLEDVRVTSANTRILILDGLTDPRNLGALLRTAEAVGVQYVVIPKDRSVGVTPTVAKASAGAVHHLKVCRVTNLRRAITALKKQGFWIVGLDAQATESLYARTYAEKIGVVLGSEGGGIRPIIKRECDFLVHIPMCGRVGSLNVAVSGAVFLYEALRQQLQAGTSNIRLNKIV